jgi:hypothetical protein
VVTETIGIPMVLLTVTGPEKEFKTYFYWKIRLPLLDKTYFNFHLVLLNMFAITLLRARKYHISKRQSDIKEAAIIQFFSVFSFIIIVNWGNVLAQNPIITIVKGFKLNKTEAKVSS